MKVETKWNLGNFTIALVSEATDAQRDILLARGLLHAGQRVSAIDKALGGFTTGADGKAKRKDGWKRTDTAYSADVANKLANAFAELEIADDVKLKCNVTVTEYVPTQADSKFTEEKAIMSRHESANDLEAWLKDKVGYDGATHGDDGEFAVDALRAVRAFKIEFLKTQL